MKFTQKIKVIGVSTGLGVSLFPFKKHLVANIEPRGIFHTPGNEQWKLNFPGIPLFKNKDWADDLFLKADVIISSPDCGAGSVLRYSRAKKLGDHKLNISLSYFFLSVVKFTPKFFLFENLTAIWKSFPKERFIYLTSEYRLIEIERPMSAFGNSQVDRKRLVIVGIRRDIPDSVDKYFQAPNKKDKIKTCIDLYGDLKEENFELGHVREDPENVISIHGGCRMSIGDITKQWTLRKNHTRWKVIGKNYATAPGVYRNLKNDYPKTARKANRQFDHNGYMLSPRQLARIMGVPDTFKIYFQEFNQLSQSYSRKNYWINKGRTTITKGMCYEVPVWFKKCLIKTQKSWLNLK